MEFIKVTTFSQCEVIAQLAKEIIPEHYGSFLPSGQINFFIETYQSANAVKDQLQNGFEYYLIKESGAYAAYLGIEKKNNLLVLSKIYTRKDYRGKGIGNKMMEIVYQRAEALNLKKIELYVVKENEKAIEFYQRHGFEIETTISNPYDSGYTVEEYKMQKLIS